MAIKPFSAQTTREMRAGAHQVLKNIQHAATEVVCAGLNSKYRPARVAASCSYEDGTLAKLEGWYTMYVVTTQGNIVLQGECRMEEFPPADVEATMALLAGSEK